MEENKNKDSYDIPSFVMQKDEDVDMSYFQMEEEPQNEEPTPSKGPKKPNQYRTQRIIILSLIVALILAIIGGGVWWVMDSQKKAQEAEQLRLKQEAEKKAAEEKAAAEKKALEDEKAKQEALRAEQLGTYMLQMTVNIRTAPSTDAAKADYASLPSNIKDNTSDAVLPEGMTVEVLDIKEDQAKQMKWGKIGDNLWFCISSGSDIYATKEK